MAKFAKKSEIEAALSKIESDHDVRILFAAESGSRAWGFESPDSDWDIRFIYVRPIERYLSIDRTRNTIERMDVAEDLDMSGWDLFKACALLRKSNPALIEWLGSPMAYRDSEGIHEAFRGLAADHVSLKSAGYHYSNMAGLIWMKHINDKTSIRLKKYLYAIRTIMCARWLFERGTFPPTRFADVLVGLDLSDEVREAISELLTVKMSAGERKMGERIPVLDEFMFAAFDKWRIAVKSLAKSDFPSEPLDALIQGVLIGDRHDGAM